MPSHYSLALKADFSVEQSPAAHFPPSVSSLPLLIQDVFSLHPIGPIAFGQLPFPFQAAHVVECTAAYHCDVPQFQPSSVGPVLVSP